MSVVGFSSAVVSDVTEEPSDRSFLFVDTSYSRLATSLEKHQIW
jgi:hypothetical protein